MKKFAALSALCLSLTAALPAFADPAPVPDAAQAQTLRDAVRADRKAVVLKAMQLDEAQTKRFLPIYEAYERELSVLNRQFTRMSVEFVGVGDKPTNAQSKYFSRGYLGYVDAEQKLYKKYHPRVVKAVGEVGAAHFLSVERRIRALQDYDLWI
ncbi:hypothetical protein [Roseateles chitosanitabidus]|jgi:hypothetical protein|uniref:hypothetical protein n=1 Tax=Roseateles chitosanitabidus TaxID=65048 RepID=UPI00082FFE7A|nr:hypothetical protein [Roseateles chitosanitabidus]MBO9686602.1 hypothetical protein [Roseateles chitosanitabidus]